MAPKNTAVQAKAENFYYPADMLYGEEWTQSGK